MMVVSVPVCIRGWRGIRHGRRFIAKDAANESPHMAENLWSAESLDVVNEESSLLDLPGELMVVVKPPPFVNVIRPVLVLMRLGSCARACAEMRVRRASPSVLDELVQHGTNPDRAREGETQRHVTGDKLLNCPDHRVDSASDAVVSFVFNSLFRQSWPQSAGRAPGSGFCKETDIKSIYAGQPSLDAASRFFISLPSAATSASVADSFRPRHSRTEDAFPPWSCLCAWPPGR